MKCKKISFFYNETWIPGLFQMKENINVMITEFSMQVEEDTAFYLRVRFHCAATKTR